LGTQFGLVLKVITSVSYSHENKVKLQKYNNALQCMWQNCPVVMKGIWKCWVKVLNTLTYCIYVIYCICVLVSLWILGTWFSKNHKMMVNCYKFIITSS